MIHNNYLNITANTNYELGYRLGEISSEITRKIISVECIKQNWKIKKEYSKKYLDPTNKYFPHLISELEGYSKGSNVDFYDFWTLSLEDELNHIDKCTTVVTNDGKLIGHNEDWEKGSKDKVILLKKTIRNISVFELYYFNTLGGNSISINSYGNIHAVNTLNHKDKNIGVPKNVIARYLSEIEDIEEGIEKLKEIPRSSGYSHIFIDKNSKLTSIESSATKLYFSNPKTPFVHTNHFLFLKEEEDTANLTYTKERFNKASNLVKDNKSIDQLEKILGDNSEGEEKSLFNNRTIARMLIDNENNNAKVWLKREEEKGFVEYINIFDNLK